MVRLKKGCIWSSGVVSSKLWYDKLKGVLLTLRLRVHRLHHIIVACDVDDSLMCYNGESNLPDKFEGELKKYFTAITLDIATPLIHVGLETAKYQMDIISL